VTADAGSVIHREAQRLLRLIGNALRVSRANAAPALTLAPVAAHDALVGAARTAEPALHERGVRYVLDVEEPGAVLADADALQQVLLNLLDNAVRYGPGGQTITLRARRVDGCVQLVVEDEGPGLPATQRGRVLRRFVRLARDRDTHRTGAGIGLAVVRELVEAMGGRVVIGTTGIQDDLPRPASTTKGYADAPDGNGSRRIAPRYARGSARRPGELL
jgi:two-component system phosphate regulon sensor histidine kinase PhoR